MTIDHIAASGVLFNRYGIKSGYLTDLSKNPNTGLMIGSIMRLIGRIAFPIFLFFLVYGMFMTHDPKKKIKKLFIFGIISEIPFSLATYDTFPGKSRNVMFTFTLVAGLIVILQYIDDFCKTVGFNRIVQGFIELIAVGVFTFLIEFIKADYGYVATIGAYLIYLSLYSRKQTTLSLAILSIPQAQLYGTIFLALPLIYLYNGKISNKENYKKNIFNKNFFYIYYPLHLIVIYGLKQIL